MLLLDGRKIRDERLPLLAGEFSALPFKPTLAIIQVGDRPDSNSYINQKKILAEKLGVKIWHLKFSIETEQGKVVEEIINMNNDSEIQGIIVQLPLPESWDKKNIINTIIPEKDIDGLTEINQNKLYSSNFENLKGIIIPATALGVLSMLNYYGIKIAGKKAVVVGRSELVGKPIAQILCLNGAEVTVCHKQTENVPDKTKTADILVIAAGSPKLIGLNGIKPEQVIIDVGINKNIDGKMVGDVDFELVKDHVYAISPVPGGVGPLTVISLFENLLVACKSIKF